MYSYITRKSVPLLTKSAKIMDMMGGGFGAAAQESLGLLFNMYERGEQYNYQRKIMDRQEEANKRLADYNQGLAMEMWDKTASAQAQRKRLEEAGLNVGLMYRQGGPGGTTSGGQAGPVSGGQAASNLMPHGMGLEVGMRMAATKAEIDLIKAQEEKTRAEAAKVKGVDTEKVGADIASIAANVKNAEVQNEILKYESQIKQTEASVATETQWDVVEQIRNANDRLEAEIQSAIAKGKIDQATADDIIHQVNTASTEQALRISAQKAGLIKTTAETDAIKTSISKMLTDIKVAVQGNMREWDKLEYQARETIVKEVLAKNAQLQTEFNTSTPEQIKQWTSIITDIIGAGPKTITHKK